MWIWLILIPVGFILLMLLLSFLSGLITSIPLPVTKLRFANQIQYIIDLSEGLHPEVEYSDSADLAFNQKILNPKLEKIRQDCLEIGRLHRSDNQLHYCDSIGVLKLKELLRELSEGE
jgi:hypothetical protein